MADLRITELQLAAAAAETQNIPVDDGIQTYRLTVAQLRAFLTPAGSLLPFAGSTAPAGFLFCSGQLVSRVTYAALFAAIGTTYGAGDGSTTFALPDLRGRVLAGKDDMGGTPASRLTNTGGGTVNGAVLGASGGVQVHTLTTAELAAHSHTVNAHTHGISTQGDHQHTMYAQVNLGGGSNGTARVSNYGNTPAGSGFQSTLGAFGGAMATSGNHNHGGATDSASPGTNNAGSGTAHNNTQPTLVVNYLIKT